MNVALVLSALAVDGITFDNIDPGVAAMLKSLQNRLDKVQLRLVNLEVQFAASEANIQIAKSAPVSLVPFERRLFPWIGRLAQAVADEWGVSADELLGHCRQATLIRPRFVLDWAVKQSCDYSLSQIGRLLNRDHSTVIYACRRVNEWREGDEVFRHVTDQLALIGRRLHHDQLASLRTRQDDLVRADDAAVAAEGGAA